MSRSRCTFALLVALALVWALPGRAATRPVAAVILDVQGQVTVLLHKASRTARPARFGQRLRIEALVEVPAGARASLGLYQGGLEVALTGPVKVEVAAGQLRKVDGSGSVAEVSRGRLSLPAAVPDPVPVPGGAVLRRQGPSATAGMMLVQVLWSDRPELRWQAVPGATYRVRLATLEGADLATFESLVPAVEAAALVARLGGPLEAGQDYLWEVSALVDGRVKARCCRTLRVLPQEECEAVAQALRLYGQGDRVARLGLAERLEAWGLWDEALSCYEALLAEDPGNQAMVERVQEARLQTGRAARALPEEER